MIEAYHLELRILMKREKEMFVAEPLEIEGTVTAPVKEHALQTLGGVLRVVFEVGEPIYRDPPDYLLKQWNAAKAGESSVDGFEAFHMTLSGTVTPETEDAGRSPGGADEEQPVSP